MSIEIKTYEVCAGGYDDDEPNYKYIDSFDCWSAAHDAYKSVSDYTWSYILHTSTNVVLMGVKP